MCELDCDVQTQCYGADINESSTPVQSDPESIWKIVPFD